MLIFLYLIFIFVDEFCGLGDLGYDWSGLKIAQGVYLGDICVFGLMVVGVVSGFVGMGELLCFGQLMNDVGLVINLMCMFYDCYYVYECLVEVQGSGYLELCGLVLDLFEVYQVVGEWIGLVY